jgi:NADPH-dependent 2,4-dienoyl-CoA reductase/sulfur reductase-like enzyme
MTEKHPEFTKRSGRASPHDRRATERWVNEGGRVASDAVLEREAADDARRAPTTCDHRATSPREPDTAKARRQTEPTVLSRRARPRVVIAGGGVAGLETLLALRALARDRVDHAR